MIKDCLVDIHDVKVLIKYDESIKLYDILHSLNDKCRFKVNRNKFDCHDLAIELVNWTKDETFDRLGFRKKDKEIRIPIKKNRKILLESDICFKNLSILYALGLDLRYTTLVLISVYVSSLSNCR